jgi:acyl carrier protein
MRWGRARGGLLGFGVFEKGGDWMALEDRISELIVDQLGVTKEEIVPEASFIDDLGADSLDIVELVMAMEETFDIEIPDDDAEKIQTIGDALTYVKERVGVAAEA